MKLSPYQEFIHLSRYARWLEDAGRRETWKETVARYISFWKKRFTDPAVHDMLNTAHDYILNMDVMPSMRALMTAGPALEQENVAGYNCCYVPISEPEAFSEIMYILMCGTGVGFSVESSCVEQLPSIAGEFVKDDTTTIVVEDSRRGWATALRELLSYLYEGRIPRWDFSRVRPAGARLKTFGGRASGPDPLANLFNYARSLFVHAAGRQLTTLECHDLVCKIADIVVVGGVRRSALISLSDLSDESMALAKSGNWWETDPHRALANISAVYGDKPNMWGYLDEMRKLYDSRSGERGIFNRYAARLKANQAGRNKGIAYGTNPCGEIILRPKQFCNLTEVVVRPEDDLYSLLNKVNIAAFLGTLQSSLTDFNFLSPEWTKNSEEERLLGVSLTGVFDSPWVTNADYYALSTLQRCAIDTNAIWAKVIGIQTSASVTTIKPSGTVSQLVDAASGVHPRYAPFYIRRVRGDNKDPLTVFMKNAGVPNEPDQQSPANVTVFSFPAAAPKGAVTTKDLGLQKHFDLYLRLVEGWCDHNASVTFHVQEDEWLSLFCDIYNNWDDIVGVTMLPYSDHVYTQAPYEEISEEEYRRRLEEFPEINWELLRDIEVEDGTRGTRDLACSAGVCEIVDLV